LAAEQAQAAEGVAVQPDRCAQAGEGVGVVGKACSVSWTSEKPITR
jgi:hypothetical protein